MAKKTTSTTKSTVTPDLKKLKLLVTIIDRTKALFYTDLLEQYEVNMQMVCMGRGTANNEMLELVGLASSDKAIILSMIREDNLKEILNVLEEKFKKVKNGKGIAFTVPVKSLIGVSMYQFLSNNKTQKKEDK
jgi:hypothetical protein